MGVTRADAQPAFQDRRIDTSEVGGHLRLAVAQVAQARHVAGDTAAHARAGEQHDARRPVIRAAGAVLPDRSAELAERQHGDSFGKLCRVQVLEERGHRPGKLQEQLAVRVLLGGMRVEAALSGVEDPRAEIRLQQPGCQLEPFRQTGGWIPGRIITAGNVRQLF